MEQRKGGATSILLSARIKKLVRDLARLSFAFRANRIIFNAVSLPSAPRHGSHRFADKGYTQFYTDS